MNEQTIFTEALERMDPEERDAFLAQACQGDPSRRQRIDRLLAQHQCAADFLETPLLRPTSLERRARRRGRPALIEQIGEGGMDGGWRSRPSLKRLGR